jgi:hypothetical protein
LGLHPFDMFLHELLLFRSERSPRAVPRYSLCYSSSGSDIKQHWWRRSPLPGPPSTHGFALTLVLNDSQRRLLLCPRSLRLEAADVRIRRSLILRLFLSPRLQGRQWIELFDGEGQLPQDLGVDEL